MLAGIYLALVSHQLPNDVVATVQDGGMHEVCFSLSLNNHDKLLCVKRLQRSVTQEGL
jgi:hypothetical protein